MSLTRGVMMLPGGSGETLTITCFTCGMPSSKEWAQKIRSRPGQTPNKPYYPFLLQIHPPSGSNLRDDGTTFVCAFCHASLESQWKTYERQQPNGVPPMNRKYNLYKYICAVCGVETYRKRVRTLPFQEFPFLTNQRPAGSLTLGNNPLAIVCLDCSETLWAQSAEYDRWGLPVHKRQFNWMARPPPPEDSVEATVARLPSGETQLPRCPPIEPVLNVRTKEVSSTTLEATSKPKTRSSKSETLEQEVIVPLRKSSSSSNGSIPGDILAVNAHPPVVTVAPMAAHGGAAKKEGTNPVRGYSPPFKYDGATNGLQPPGLMYPIFPRYLSPYATYPWGPRENHVSERFQYPSVDSIQAASAGWPWANVPSSTVLQYGGQMPSYPSRNYPNEQMYHPSHFVHFSSHMPNMQGNLNGGGKINPGSVSPASPLDKHSPDTTLNGVVYTEASADEHTKSRRNSNGRIYNGHGKRSSRSSLFEDETHVIINVNSPDGEDLGLISDSGNEPPKFNSKQYSRPVAAEIQNPSVTSGKSPKGKSIPDNPLPLISEKPVVEDRLRRKRKISQDVQATRNDIKQTPSKKFMIDYLCKSDDQQQSPIRPNRNVSSRRSVIVSSPAQKSKKNAICDKTETNDSDEKCVMSSPVSVQKSSRRKSFADVRSANKDLSETAISDSVEEENIEEYAKKLVEDYKTSLRSESARKKKALEEQEKFLNNVGLVTHAKKNDFELNRLIKQAEHHRLPPIKLRPSSPQERRDEVGPTSEKELISKLFDDPSLKQHSVNEEEASFLANVDLKPATVEEKQRRERVWRYILLDRMKRNRQQSHKLKTQKPWKSTEDLSQIASVSVQSPKAASLRQTPNGAKLPVQISESQLKSNENTKPPKSAIVPRRQGSRRSSKDESTSDKPVISYPTYTPRLASKSPTKQKSPERNTLENGEKHAPATSEASSTGQPIQNGTDKVDTESFSQIEKLSTDFENLTDRLNSLVTEVLDVTTVKPRGKAGKRVKVHPIDIEKWRRIKLFLSGQQKQFRLLEDKMNKKEKLMTGLLKSNSKHTD